MTSQSSGGSGSGLPGVTADGNTPGGEIIAGALRAGDSTASSVPTFHYLYGCTTIRESPGNQVDDDDVLDVTQQSPLGADSGISALRVTRSGALNGHQYIYATLWVEDLSGSTAPVLQVSADGVTQVYVDKNGTSFIGKLRFNTAETHTLGAYSGKSVPIYDDAGTLLGYMPLYA